MQLQNDYFAAYRSLKLKSQAGKTNSVATLVIQSRDAGVGSEGCGEAL